MVLLPSSAKYISGGLIAVSFAFVFWLNGLGNPLRDLALVRRGHTVQGKIIDTSEDIDSGDYGQDASSHNETYVYETSTGQRFIQTSPSSSGRLREDIHLPVSVEVEYLPENPSISRIKGTGSETIPEWIGRTLLSLSLFALFASPGVLLVTQGIKRTSLVKHLKRIHHEKL